MDEVNTMILKGAKVFIGGTFKETDVAVRGNKIAHLQKTDEEGEDCSGLHILPGVIDAHVHFRDFGQEYKADWVTESKAAVAAGITTVLDMPNNLQPITNEHLLMAKRQSVRSRSLVNFGLFMAVTEENIPELNGIRDLLAVKLYMGQTTGKISPGNIEFIFKKLRKDILIVVHAEDNAVIEKNRKKINHPRPKDHSKIRDNTSEYKAVERVLDFVKKYGRRVHIAHISTRQALEQIEKAKKIEHSLRLL